MTRTYEELTKRQSEVLEFITQYLASKGFPPSFREIGEHFGFNSPNSVMCHVRALAKKGKIMRGENQARGITLLEREPSGMPLLKMQDVSHAELARRGVLLK